MDMLTRITRQFEASARVKLLSAEVLGALLVRAIELLFEALSNDHRILACGNGGSAADCQHFVAELIGRFERERLPLGAVALTTDTSILTAVGNDYGYEAVFSRQVQGLGRPGDVLLAISTSGSSPNVLAAVRAAHEREMRVLALTGRGGGRMSELLRGEDVHLCVPHDQTARIQEVHALILHCLCDGIDGNLLGGNDE